jgi:hypothetical protein
MAIYIDAKYVRMVSSRLRNFKQKNTNLWNFSCPYCGDSQTNKLKARGYVYAKGNDLFYRCHNCGVGTNAANFIKHVDPSLHGEYVLEKYKSGTANTHHRKSSDSPRIITTPPKFGHIKKRSIFEHGTWLSDLPSGHFCLNYAQNRLIPEEHYDKLLFTSNYKAFCDELIPNHDKKLIEDARLVIPFFNYQN